MVVIGNFRAGNELRKKPRRQFHYRAKILIDKKGTARACSISDISHSGARLLLEKDEKLPPRFLLLLSAPGGARRICRLVWRNGLTIGVEFCDNL